MQPLEVELPFVAEIIAAIVACLIAHFFWHAMHDTDEFAKKSLGWTASDSACFALIILFLIYEFGYAVREKRVDNNTAEVRAVAGKLYAVAPPPIIPAVNRVKLANCSRDNAQVGSCSMGYTTPPGVSSSGN